MCINEKDSHFIYAEKAKKTTADYIHGDRNIPLRL